MTPRPDGLDEVVATFGNPLLHVNNKRLWEQLMLDDVELPLPLVYAYDTSRLVTRVRAHKAIVHHLVDTLTACLTTGVPLDRIKYGGCYCWRAKRTDPTQLSLHTWGIAVDLEPVENPLGKVWLDDGVMLDPRIIDVFEDHGWFWGGMFHGTVDPQHFQWASGV